MLELALDLRTTGDLDADGLFQVGESGDVLTAQPGQTQADVSGLEFSARLLDTGRVTGRDALRGHLHGLLRGLESLLLDRAKSVDEEQQHER